MTDDFLRYKRSELINFDGQETYGRWVQPSFITERPPDDQIKVFKVTTANAGRPDIISYIVYGTPDLFWVLLAFNNVRETLNWPAAGDIIEYPIDSVVIPNVL